MKTEAAGRPLRLNELTDLARVLGVRASHLAATETDMWLEMIQNNVVAYSGAAARLKADIDELNRILAEKTQAYEKTRRLLGESREQFDQARADGIASHGKHQAASRRPMVGTLPRRRHQQGTRSPLRPQDRRSTVARSGHGGAGARASMWTLERVG